MSVGIIMLVHAALGRAEQVARHWAASDCPVVIHVDRSVAPKDHDAFVTSLDSEANISFSAKRFRCEWGQWGIVAATQAAAEQLLAAYPDVHHVYLSSGSCLPLRPVNELKDYLAERPQTDFIESATTSEVSWIVGGLGEERFTLRFPFSFKRQRILFDKFVGLQRTLKIKRKLPNGLVPHMGSQWWCLSRRTLTAILQDPARRHYDAYFKQVWIPDESYFQTLARQYSAKIESRSLTLSKFDYQGKPHMFYDDHLQLLRRSDCFVARKIWPDAQRLYSAFLSDSEGDLRREEPNPGKIDRLFSKAVDRRVKGRAGLYMQSRFPRRESENGVSAGPYSIFQGFADLFEDFDTWLARATDARVHGHLFAPDKAHFAHGDSIVNGAMSDNACLRDYNPNDFLSNLLWNTRGEWQCFQFGPGDNQAINHRVAVDRNAHISVISGAWAIPLFRSNADFGDIRQKAADLQKIESEQLKRLRSSVTKARVRIWTMADFVEAPIEPLHEILHDIGMTGQPRLSEMPRMVDLTGFGQFLQTLKNQGMHPYLMGDFPIEPPQQQSEFTPRPKPYLVR